MWNQIFFHFQGQRFYRDKTTFLYKFYLNPVVLALLSLAVASACHYYHIDCRSLQHERIVTFETISQYTGSILDRLCRHFETERSLPLPFRLVTTYSFSMHPKQVLPHCTSMPWQNFLNASIALTQVHHGRKKIRRLTTVTKKWAVTIGCPFQHNNSTEELAVSHHISFGQRTYVTLDATSVTLTRHYRSVSAQHQCTALETLMHHFACAFPFCMQNNTPYHSASFFVTGRMSLWTLRRWRVTEVTSQCGSPNKTMHIGGCKLT